MLQNGHSLRPLPVEEDDLLRLSYNFIYSRGLRIREFRFPTIFNEAYHYAPEQRGGRRRSTSVATMFVLLRAADRRIIQGPPLLLEGVHDIRHYRDHIFNNRFLHAPIHKTLGNGPTWVFQYGNFDNATRSKFARSTCLPRPRKKLQ